ncbi:MAG TPA: hypothetical protein VIT38_02295 [Allosphingosinicella sp.]|jgi:hypothetical protein
MVSKVKIPKNVAGVKVPRKVRKKANKAIKAATSPQVRRMAKAAIGAAGRRVQAEGVGRVRHLHGAIHIEGSAVAEAFRTAAIDGFRRFLEGFEEGLRNAQASRAAENAGDNDNRARG